jgi:hypothetical protein
MGNSTDHKDPTPSNERHGPNCGGKLITHIVEPRFLH